MHLPVRKQESKKEEANILRFYCHKKEGAFRSLFFVSINSLLIIYFLPEHTLKKTRAIFIFLPYKSIHETVSDSKTYGAVPDAVSSLKAILAQNSVMPVDVIAKLESIEESLRYFKWILAEE
ncbi:MAG: hypothetical protein PARBA_01993 [Parabacteroides sp.]